MNSKRIVIGGLLAGLLINAGQGLLGLLAVGRSAPADAANVLWGTMPLAVTLLRGFLLGLFCVLLYAALRPQLGMGARTAATAGLLAFLFGVLFPPLGTGLTAGMPGRVLLLAIVGQAIILPLATMAGAWLYREVEPRPAAPAPAT